MVSRRRSNSPDGTTSATRSPWATTDTVSPCSAWRTTSDQDGWSSARIVTADSLMVSGYLPERCG